MNTLYVCLCFFTPWSSFGWWVFEVPVSLGKRNSWSVSGLGTMLFPDTMLSLHAMPLRMSIVKESAVLLSLDECGWKHSVYIFFGSSYVYASHFPCDTLGACNFPILQENRLDAASLCLPIATVTISLGIICSRQVWESSRSWFNTGKRECSKYTLDSYENVLMWLRTTCKERDF